MKDLAGVGSVCRHSNVESSFEELKAKLGEALLVVPEGPESIVVSGAWVSTSR